MACHGKPLPNNGAAALIKFSNKVLWYVGVKLTDR